MLTRLAALVLGGLLLLLVQPILTQSTPDYTCSATKHCSLGCCGPLQVPPVRSCSPEHVALTISAETRPRAWASVAWAQRFVRQEIVPASAMPSLSVTRAGERSGRRPQSARSMSAVQSLGSAELLQTFATERRFLRPIALAARVPTRRRLGTTRGGILTDPVDVSSSWPLTSSPSRQLMNLAGMAPEDIPLGYYTHINFAFALVNPTTFHIEDMAPSTAALYDRVTALKKKDINLKVWIGMFHAPEHTLSKLAHTDIPRSSRRWLVHERPWSVPYHLFRSGRVYHRARRLLRVPHHLHDAPQL